MTEIISLLSPGAIAAGVTVSSSKALFQLLGQMAEREYHLNAGDVVDKLVERERLGSTGFGGGVAIPHGKIDGLDHVVGIFLQLANPVDVHAIDDLPVDLIFCLLSPPDAGSEHLKALAQVSRWLRNPGFVAKLRGAGSADAIYALFSASQTRDAA
jgi:PTS system nitrogen regulatory IIA component